MEFVEGAGGLRRLAGRRDFFDVENPLTDRCLPAAPAMIGLPLSLVRLAASGKHKPTGWLLDIGGPSCARLGNRGGRPGVPAASRP
ncbi:hypothetical protein, partial [Paenibacillus arenilitoris]